MPKATVAIEDRRFYAARRHRRRGHRPRALEERQRRAGRRGRLDDHAAARAQPLHRPRAHGRAEAEGGVPRDQAGQRLGEEPDPRHVHEPGLLRQPRVRDRGGRADVLLEARQRAQPPGGGADRRAAAGAVQLRPVPPARRSRPPAATRCCARCSTRATSTRRSTTGRSRAGSASRPGKLYKEIREPDFFGYVRDQLIAEYGAGTVRSGGLKVYTTIDPRFQRAAQAAISETLYEPDDPAAA